MSKDPREYLRHIQDECTYIISVSENLVFENFMADETLKRAVVRSLEIIGEATKKNPSRCESAMEFHTLEKHGGHARSINSRLHWSELRHSLGRHAK